MSDTTAEHPDHPASQADDGSYRGEEHSFLDGPDAEKDGFTHTADHSHVYHNLMRIGFAVGLPIGCAVAMLVTLLLLSTSFFLAVFLSFMTWLGVYGFSKTFFVEVGAEGEEH